MKTKKSHSEAINIMVGKLIMSYISSLIKTLVFSLFFLAIFGYLIFLLVCLI